MEDLKILDLYNNANETQKEKFMESIESSVHVKTDYEKTEVDSEWIDKMEITVPYLDNILRNPNRFIVNEEEIVKIELARKITVDSIKHLSKHTNLIQEVDEENGDVKPSKILNINKEESYDTYENRLIYTLIKNMTLFINQRKKQLEKFLNIEEKDDRLIEFNGKSIYKDESIQMNLQVISKKDVEKLGKQKKDILERIEKLEKKILDLKNTETYKILEKSHVSIVRPPLKKTNLILKNVNFQYAVELWNYLQANMDDNTKNVTDKQDFFDEGKIKQKADENFLLNYLLIDSLKKEEDDYEEQEQVKVNLINQMIDKILDLGASLTEEQLSKLIGDRFEKRKYIRTASIEELQKLYIKHIDKYLEKLK